MVHLFYNSFLRKSPFSFLRSYSHSTYYTPCTEKKPFSVITHESSLFFSIYTDTNVRFRTILRVSSRYTHPHMWTYTNIKNNACVNTKSCCAQKKNGRFTIFIYRSIHLSFNNFKYFFCVHTLCEKRTKQLIFLVLCIIPMWYNTKKEKTHGSMSKLLFL